MPFIVIHIMRFDVIWYDAPMVADGYLWIDWNMRVSTDLSIAVACF